MRVTVQQREVVSGALLAASVFTSLSKRAMGIFSVDARAGFFRYGMDRDGRAGAAVDRGNLLRRRRRASAAPANWRKSGMH